MLVFHLKNLHSDGMQRFMKSLHTDTPCSLSLCWEQLPVLPVTANCDLVRTGRK